MLMYLFTGLAGLPFFSGSVAGLAILKSPTIGYIIGFFIAAQIIGRLSHNPIVGITLGTLTIYITGVFGLMMILNMSMMDAFSIGVVPFVIGDLIKAALAVLIAYQIK